MGFCVRGLAGWGVSGGGDGAVGFVKGSGCGSSVPRRGRVVQFLVSFC